MRWWDTTKELWEAPSTGQMFIVIGIGVFAALAFIEAKWPWLLHWSG